MDPHWAIHIEIADEFGVVFHPRAVIPCHVIAPLFKTRTVEIRLPAFDLPLVRFSKRQQVAVGHIQPLVFFERKISGVAMVVWIDGDKFLNPSHGIKPPIQQIGADVLQPGLH